jgi:hypothetical protein
MRARFINEVLQPDEKLFDLEEIKFIDEKNYRKIELSREELLKEPEKKDETSITPVELKNKTVEKEDSQNKNEEKQKTQQKTLFDF